MKVSIGSFKTKSLKLKAIFVTKLQNELKYLFEVMFSATNKRQDDPRNEQESSFPATEKLERQHPTVFGAIADVTKKTEPERSVR